MSKGFKLNISEITCNRFVNNRKKNENDKNDYTRMNEQSIFPVKWDIKLNRISRWRKATYVTAVKINAYSSWASKLLNERS